MNVLAFNVEKEYCCYMKEETVSNIDLFIWQCFVPELRAVIMMCFYYTAL